MEEIYKNLSLENLENEEWRDIEGYNGKYQVSSLGRVKSLKDNKGNSRDKILSQCECSNGYLFVVLCKEGKVKTFIVHRLVANAFIPNPNGYRCVNHKDECKTNNCVDNLEWCTHQYNNTYGTIVQRRVASTDFKAFQARRVASTDWKSVGRKNAEKLSRQVYQYDKNGELVAIWQSANECGRNGFNQGNVTSCCNNCFNREGNNIYKDFIWSYYPL